MMSSEVDLPLENESIITVNVSDVHASFIYTATAVYGSVVIGGTITVTLFIATLLKGHSTFREYPFFKIVWALTIVNAIHMFMQITCIFPSLFMNIEADTIGDYWYSFSSRVVETTDYGASIFLLLMALNRFAVFVFPLMQPLFSKRAINKMIFIGFLITIFVTCMRIFFLKPIRKFSKTNWEFTSVFALNDGFIYNFITMSSYIIPIIIFAIYICIYAFLRKKRAMLRKAQPNDSNLDLNLLREGFLLAISLIICRLFTTWAPRINDSVVLGWVINITKSIASTFNNMLNPILFLSSNATVRKTFRKLMKCQPSDPIIALSDSDIPSARRSLSLGARVRLRVPKFAWKNKIASESPQGKGVVSSSSTRHAPSVMIQIA